MTTCHFDAILPEAEVRSLLVQRGKLVENWLQNCLNGLPARERLHQAMRYSLLAGGKRLRPVLCLSTAALFGLSAEKVISFAGTLEMIHTYSLIHDDLPAMDDDDLRRGKPSCHKAFDEATAILAGDALLTDAFGLMACCDLPAERILAAIRDVAISAGSPGMVGGQMLDMELTGRDSKNATDITTLRTLHALKTGAMFRTACLTGGLLAGADEQALDALRDFGNELGVTFQIVDDILDETSDTATLGKPAGSDVENGKVTYPSLLGLAESQKLALLHAESAVKALAAFTGQEAAFLRGLALMLVSRTN